jgi:hypothetical protein
MLTVAVHRWHDLECGLHFRRHHGRYLSRVGIARPSPPAAVDNIFPEAQSFEAMAVAVGSPYQNMRLCLGLNAVDRHHWLTVEEVSEGLAEPSSIKLAQALRKQRLGC